MRLLAALCWSFPSRHCFSCGSTKFSTRFLKTPQAKIAGGHIQLACCSEILLCAETLPGSVCNTGELQSVNTVDPQFFDHRASIKFFLSTDPKQLYLWPLSMQHICPPHLESQHNVLIFSSLRNPKSACLDRSS